MNTFFTIVLIAAVIAIAATPAFLPTAIYYVISIL